MKTTQATESSTQPMQAVPFKQVDVFTTQAFGGNPVAVILDAEGLDDMQMQRIACWTNLSETAFLLPPSVPDADYRVRIFTPAQELPFAGHPSVGVAYAALEAGLITPHNGQLRQECAAGILPVEVETTQRATRITLRTPSARSLPLPPGWQTVLDAALAGLRRGALAPALLANGPRWWLVELESEAEVRRHQPDLVAIAALSRATDSIGLAVFAEAAEAHYQWVVRGYCPADGIPEDPITGSANALIGALLLAQKRLRLGERYVASQGRETGRDGMIEVRLQPDGIWIGGGCVTVIDGMIRFQ